MLGLPVATEFLLAISALFGSITATALAFLALWKKVLKPIRDNIREELDGWTEMRLIVAAQFKTNGMLGLREAMNHTVSSLARIAPAVEAIMDEQVGAKQRGEHIQEQLDAVLEEQSRVRENLRQLNGEKS